MCILIVDFSCTRVLALLVEIATHCFLSHENNLMSNIPSQLPITTDDLIYKDVLLLSLEEAVDIACVLRLASIANISCSSVLGNDNSDLCPP